MYGVKLFKEDENSIENEDTSDWLMDSDNLFILVNERVRISDIFKWLGISGFTTQSCALQFFLF